MITLSIMADQARALAKTVSARAETEAGPKEDAKKTLEREL